MKAFFQTKLQLLLIIPFALLSISADDTATSCIGSGSSDDTGDGSADETTAEETAAGEIDTASTEACDVVLPALEVVLDELIVALDTGETDCATLKTEFKDTLATEIDAILDELNADDLVTLLESLALEATAGGSEIAEACDALAQFLADSGESDEADSTEGEKSASSTSGDSIVAALEDFGTDSGCAAEAEAAEGEDGDSEATDSGDTGESDDSGDTGEGETCTDPETGDETECPEGGEEITMDATFGCCQDMLDLSAGRAVYEGNTTTCESGCADGSVDASICAAHETVVSGDTSAYDETVQASCDGHNAESIGEPTTAL